MASGTISISGALPLVKELVTHSYWQVDVFSLEDTEKEKQFKLFFRGWPVLVTLLETFETTLE